MRRIARPRTHRRASAPERRGRGGRRRQGHGGLRATRVGTFPPTAPCGGDLRQDAVTSRLHQAAAHHLGAIGEASRFGRPVQGCRPGRAVRGVQRISVTRDDALTGQAEGDGRLTELRQLGERGGDAAPSSTRTIRPLRVSPTTAASRPSPSRRTASTVVRIVASRAPVVRLTGWTLTRQLSSARREASRSPNGT